MENEFRDRRSRMREGKIFKFIIFFVAIASLVTLIVMTLWNLILPEVLGVKEINFWQALGILLLSKILFGGFHGGWSQKKQQWKQHMFQKWQHMTPEEREKFKQEWKNRCGPPWRRQPFPTDPGQKEQSQV